MANLVKVMSKNIWAKIFGKRESYYFGLFAERVAIFFLICKGYKILHRRHKTKFGEIDIIAKKQKLVIFIEVKARKSKLNIEEIFTLHQASRIKNAAQFFIAKNYDLQNYNLRFDLIEVNKYFFIKHNINFIS